MSFKVYDLGKISKTQWSDKNLAIINGNKVILVEDDACHTVSDMDEAVLKNGMTAREILATEPVSEVNCITEHIPYFGIKDRVHRNYKLLLNSIKEIGLDPSTFPAWKKQ